MRALHALATVRALPWSRSGDPCSPTVFLDQGGIGLPLSSPRYKGGKTSPPRLYSSPRVGCTRASRGGLCVTGASGSMDVGAPRSTPRPHPNPLPAGEGGKTSPPRLYSSPRVGCTRVSRGGEAGGKGSGRPREAPLREGMDSRFRGNDGYGRVSQGSPLGPRRTPTLCVLAALSARMTQVAADQFVGVS